MGLKLFMAFKRPARETLSPTAREFRDALDNMERRVTRCFAVQLVFFVLAVVACLKWL